MLKVYVIETIASHFDKLSTIYITRLMNYLIVYVYCIGIMLSTYVI